MLPKVEEDYGKSTCNYFSENFNASQKNCAEQLSAILTPAHQEDLKSSGLSDEQIIATGHFSADRATAKDLIGHDLEGLTFNYRDPSGRPYLRKDGKPFYRIKPDWGDRKTEDSPKYLSSKDEGCRPYFSRLCPNWKKIVKSSKVDLWETEGEKKGDCGCTHGLPVMAFAGVDSWVDRCPRSDEDKLRNSRVLPELSVIEWKNRRVNQCFDSDIIEKLPVQTALAKRAATLIQSGAKPYLVLLPNEIDGSKNGLDDFIVRHDVEALKVLAKDAKPTLYKTEEVEGEDGKKKVNYFLKLEEPDSHTKALMAWSVLKETWAYRPGSGWYEWQGTHWKPKTLEEFEEVLTRFMDAQNWKMRSSGLITSIVRELKSRLLVRDEYWSPQDKLAFSNGTLNVHSGEFVPAHDPYDRITRLRPYEFDPSTQCPTWLQFILEAMEGDEDRVKLIRAIFRYASLPRTRDRKAEIERSFDFFGPKGTGKGTTLEVLTNLVGCENIGSASAATFKNAIGLGQLLDKDLAIDHDASGFLSNVGNYNKVVSNEPVEVKKLYQDTHTVRLGVVVVRAYNAFIGVPDGSEGLDRRMIVIPFRHQPKTMDTGLSQKLEQELPGIFAWCYSMSAEEMKQRILSAGSIRAVAEMSIERFEANNPEFRFLVEMFPEGKDSIKAGDLYQSYVEWSQENHHQPKSNVRFSSVIKTLGCQRSSGKIHGCYYYTIPKMADFDVAAHLGIVQRQLGDSCRDSSNPDTERKGDSWGHFDEQSSKNFEQTKTEVEKDINKRNVTQPSSTIPQPVPEPLSTVSQVSPTVSTVSTPEQACRVDDLSTSSVYEPIPDPWNDEVDTKAAVIEDWQPQVGDRVEILKDDTWNPGVITRLPNKHEPNPVKRCRFWQVKLDAGSERYVWQIDDLRPVQVDC